MCIAAGQSHCDPIGVKFGEILPAKMIDKLYDFFRITEIKIDTQCLLSCPSADCRSMCAG